MSTIKTAKFTTVEREYNEWVVTGTEGNETVEYGYAPDEATAKDLAGVAEKMYRIKCSIKPRTITRAVMVRCEA